METMLSDIEEADAYFDDVKCWSESWPQHLMTLKCTLSRLEEAGFSINLLKCEWGVQETDWLGYWVTPNGLKPWHKKIDAILKLAPPLTLKKVRPLKLLRFIVIYFLAVHTSLQPVEG